MAKSTAKKKAPAKKAAAKADKKPALPKVKKPVVGKASAKKVVPIRVGADDDAKDTKAPKAAPSAGGITVEDEGTYEWPESRARFGGSSALYPFATMEKGQSFFIPAEKVDASAYSSETEANKAQSEACSLVANRLSGAVRRFTKRNAGYTFQVKTVNDTQRGWGIRVRRTE